MTDAQRLTNPLKQLTLEPIGFVRSAAADKAEAARQPRASRGAPGRIELLPGRNFEHALCDLADWQYIWVLFWFDRNEGWRPKVLPPRSRHTGGVHCLFADGAVRFLSDNIDTGNLSMPNPTSGRSPYGVWGALGSKDGGESANIGL